MRVTDLTKQNAVLRNIQNNSERLQNLQEEMASGRRINRLSDDPIGATQVQDFRTKLSHLDTIKHNIKQNYIWLDRTEQELAQMGDMLRQAKTLILAQVNDSSDDASRRVTAEELRDITESLYQAGNAKINKVFIFSGSKTLTQPLVKNESVQTARVRTEKLAEDQKFLLDPEPYQASFEGFSRRDYIVRITQPGTVGRAHYQVSDDGGETWSREKTLLPVVELVNEDGAPSEKVTLRLEGEQQDKLGEPIVFPRGLEFVFQPNPPIDYVGNDDKRMVPTSEGRLQPVNLTAREVFFADPEKPESVDIFGLLQGLQRSLLDNDPIPLEQRLGELDRAQEQVLSFRADVGAVRREMESQMRQAGDREFNNTKQLSEVEDLNFPEAVTEMNLADVRHRATLDTSSRLIQPSLLGFLR